MLLKLYIQSLLNASFEVDDCVHITDAEELIKSKRYDIIILDILFPGRDIYPTIRLIRSKITPNTETPILVLTNLTYGEKTKKVLELGANKCLLKVNQTPKTIIKMVNQLINNKNPQENRNSTDKPGLTDS